MNRKRVLIAEDNDLNRDLLIQLLEERWDVIEAVNGLEAVEKAVTDRPDLILMDLSMPVLDGWEATELIKRRPITQGIPVVAVSARAMQDEISRAEHVGVDDFIVLPLDETRLFATMGRLLGLSPTQSAPAH